LTEVYLNEEKPMPRSTSEVTPIEILLPSDTLAEDLRTDVYKPSPSRPKTDDFWPRFLMVLLRSLSAWGT